MSKPKTPAAKPPRPPQKAPKPKAPKRKRSRRKDARPGEIVAAAIELFLERGFNETRLSVVAERAGVAKGTIYLYCENKSDLFRQVARAILAEAVVPFQQAPQQALPFPELIRGLLTRAAANLADARLAGIARFVITESRAFPDLARIWHDEVASRLITLLAGHIAAAQASGEIRAGDPRLFAFSIVGPLAFAGLFRDIFGTIGAETPDLNKLAAQHADAILNGLLAPRSTT